MVRERWPTPGAGCDGKRVLRDLYSERLSLAHSIYNGLFVPVEACVASRVYRHNHQRHPQWRMTCFQSWLRLELNSWLS
ncbi:hypothetical protein E2C01_072442 [Portunus trituberculatus]|uniref:Uncharacterized protein n=1 Tax=Portunus trituberculatus TaxID=210409 RepID=A0A5B7I2M7_PORTR|nr:hypothetical protein [Portunus trituberculatus]